MLPSASLKALKASYFHWSWRRDWYHIYFFSVSTQLITGFDRRKRGQMPYLEDRYNICVGVQQDGFQVRVCPFPRHDRHHFAWTNLNRKARERQGDAHGKISPIANPAATVSLVLWLRWTAICYTHLNPLHGQLKFLCYSVQELKSTI